MDSQPTATNHAWEVLWAVQRSQRYHARRSAFFHRWNKATAFVSLVGGSAVFAALGEIAPAGLAIVGATVVVVMSGIDLVVGTADMARQHNDLRRQFCALEADITQVLSPGAEQVASWRARRLAIEAEEPAIYVALDVLCENELARSYRHLKDQPAHPLRWYQRWSAHLLRWENA